MMKQMGHYRDKRKTRYRIIALLICAALVVSAVAIGVIVTTSAGFATADNALTGQEDPASTGEGIVSGPGNGTDADVEEEPVPPSDPVYIEITEYPRNMNVGDKSTISYDLRNAAPDAVVKWSSSDDDIASVSSDGTVRALSEGKAEITASLGEAKASVLVSVTEKFIAPKSFKVEVAEFTSENLLEATHVLRRGDELHMKVKVDPEDATLTGAFEWNASKSGVVTIRTEGELNDVAVLRAEEDGEATVTVSYIDGNRDESKRVKLDERKLVLRVEEEKAPGPNLLLMALIIFVVIIVVILLVLIAVMRSRKRRRAEEERRERAAKKQREEARRERAKREELARLRDEGYERGYRDSEADQFERMTRVYDAPPPVPPAAPPPAPVVPAEEEAEPEKPFSVDDIE